MRSNSTETDGARQLREEMVERQIRARGVRSPRVLEAMRAVRREGYVPSYLGEFAYEDTPLPIEEEQTISQPYIVAFMTEALELEGGEKVLEIGTGSGYAAAVLGEVAGEVFTIERHQRLADTARERLADDGYRNVRVRCGDGTLGWPEEAPFDAIVVAAGGPEVPHSLREQLAVGGRLVIPVGETVGYQKLKRVRRVAEDRFEEEELGDVRFVPLVGEEGWKPEREEAGPAVIRPSIARRIAACAEPIGSIAGVDLEPLLERIGSARVVLLGEATHGTAEFYDLRAEITRALIEREGFDVVAVEADWPDAARIDHHVRDRDVPASEWEAFARFPTWMWRNRQMHEFVEWLRRYNLERRADRRVRFAGLDLYGLYNSIASILAYLDDTDPEAARVARTRYGCLTPWQSDPAAYGQAALTGAYRSCEQDVVHMLEDMLAKRMERTNVEDEDLFDAVQNARLVANAELYYRAMYYGSNESWNLRDRHMFQTLSDLLEFGGSTSRAVVWAHNSHVGDAVATDMAARGQLNIGQLCRQRLGGAAYSIGFGTHRGTVAAASHWDGPMEIKQILPSRVDSYERLCHDSGVESFFLNLRHPTSEELRRELTDPRLERAIGVIYRPETELASHYFHAVLPFQFDEYVWFDETTAVEPLETRELLGAPETYPSGL